MNPNNLREFVEVEKLKGMAPEEINQVFNSLLTRAQTAERKLEDLEELTRMQQVAISVTCMSNTRQSADQQRLDEGNQFRTTALKDVEAAIDREIALRDKLIHLQLTARKVVRDKLDGLHVHPCDEHDDAMKVRQLDPTWQNLYELSRS